jgi:3-hydroxyisobutyrate dehydrogenase
MTEGGAPRVAVLGTGIMGSAMARNLLAAGLPVTVWDRSAAVTARLARDGAQVAGSAAGAVRDADAVITMLPTAAVIESVMFGGHAAEALAPGAAWAQMGTIGVEPTLETAARLAKTRPDVLFVDAPVSGSKGPAEHGQLLILASGPDAAKQPLSKPFAAIGRNTVWLGEAGQGSRLKLVVNAYMSTLIEGVAEAVELARRLGIDVAAVDAAIGGGPLDAPIADAKLHKIASGDYAPEFPLEWALKDVDLALAAGGDGLPLLAALSRQWRAAVDAGHGREDVSAARLALLPGQQDGTHGTLPARTLPCCPIRRAYRARQLSAVRSSCHHHRAMTLARLTGRRAAAEIRLLKHGSRETGSCCGGVLAGDMG